MQTEILNAEFAQIENDPDPVLLGDGDRVGALRVQGDDRWLEIGYYDENYQAGFDHTMFKDAKTFVRVLRTVGLDPLDDFYLVQQDPSDPTYRVPVWAHDFGFIVTGCNPITGTFRYTDGRAKEPGYASYIGIEGNSGFVQDAWEAINDRADQIKDWSMHHRSYI